MAKIIRGGNNNDDKGKRLQNEMLAKTEKMTRRGKAVSESVRPVRNVIRKVQESARSTLKELEQKSQAIDTSTAFGRSLMEEVKAQQQSELRKANLYEEMGKQLEISNAAIQSLMNSAKEGVPMSKENLTKLGMALGDAMAIQNVTGNSTVDTQKILEQLKDTLDRDSLQRLEKRLTTFDNFVNQPISKTGLFTTMFRTAMVPFLGPLTDAVDTALDASSKMEQGIFKKMTELATGYEDAQKEGLHTAEKVQEIAERQSKLQETLDEKIRDDELAEIQRKRDEAAAQLKAERQERTEEFRRTRGSSFAAKFFGGDGKGGQGKSILEALAKSRLGSMLGGFAGGFMGGKGGIFARIGGGLMGAMAGGGIGQMLLGILPRLLPMILPAAGIAGALFAGFKLGEWINDNYGDEIFEFLTSITDKVGEIWDAALEKFEQFKSFLGDAYDYGIGLYQKGVNFKDQIVDRGMNNARAVGHTASNLLDRPAVQFASNMIPGLRPAMGIMSTLLPDAGATHPVQLAIQNAASEIGVPLDYMMMMAKRESNFNPNAKAGTSSAKGLYQFIDSTWSDMVEKYGAKYGIGMGDVFNPRANALMAALFAKDNMKILQSAGIPISNATLYTAHFLGAGGAKKLLSSPSNAIAAQILPDAARSNKPVFYNPDGSAKTVAEMFAGISHSMDPSKIVSAVQNAFGSSGVSSGQALPANTQNYVETPKLGSQAPQIPMAAPSNPQSSSNERAPMQTQGGQSIDDIPMLPMDQSLFNLATGLMS